MYINTSDLQRVTEDVWSCMLGLTVAPVPESDRGPPAAGLTGRVTLSGAWQGVVTVRSTRDMARRAASIMMGYEPAQLTQLEIDDTVGELANMVAGNLKGLLPGPTELSLPQVAPCQAGEATAEPVGKVVSLVLACDGQPVSIQVVKTE